MSGTQESQLVELNVGGVFYSTSLGTLTSESGSKLSNMFNNEDSVLKDSKVLLFTRQFCLFCFDVSFGQLHYQV